MASVRLFVAVPVPDLPRFRAVREAVEATSPGSYRWLAPTSFHCTLVFLGDTAPESVEEIGRRLSDVVFKPFLASVKTTQGFAQRPGRGVLVMTLGCVGHDPSLWQNLKAAVSAALDTFDRPERRQFVPHVTIARSVKGMAPTPVPSLAGSSEDVFRIDRMDLVESRLSREGPTYVTLKTVRFGAA